MKLKVKTEELQSMVGKVITCSSNNKLIPLTSLLSIGVKDGVLTLITTDATTFYYASASSKVDCEDFEVSVLADLFTKLIQKTTTAEVEIELSDDILKVNGNGTYTFELPLDNGKPIKFPNKNINIDGDKFGTMTVDNVKTIISTNKASLAKGMETPILTYYYCGKAIVTSDKQVICKNTDKLFNAEKPILISNVVMELLGTVSGTNIDVWLTDKEMVFKTDNEVLYTPVSMNPDEFPISAIDGFIEQEFPSHCKINKDKLLNIIDRLSLFITQYDKKGIYMVFSDKGIYLSSKKSSGEELLEFTESTKHTDYKCCINVDMLKDQVSSMVSEVVDLYYGSEIAVKFVDKNITQVVALIDEGGN